MADISQIKVLDGTTYNLKDSGALRSHQTVVNNAPNLTWGGTSTIGTVGGTALTATMPSKPSSSATVATATMLASGWSSGVYSFESSYPVASYDIEIEPNGASCTAAQYKAWTAAMIVGNPTANTCKALGTVPTVDIPIMIKVTAK